MKRGWVLGLLALLVLPCSAQQIMYSNLKELVEGRGDTVTILKVEKRSIRSTAGWYEAYHGLVGELPLLGTGATNGWYGVYQQEVHCWYLHLACNQQRILLVAARWLRASVP